MRYIFNEEGEPQIPLRYDATITLDALDILRVWDALQVAQQSPDLYSDTMDAICAIVERFEALPRSVDGIGPTV